MELETTGTKSGNGCDSTAKQKQNEMHREASCNKRNFQYFNGCILESQYQTETHWDFASAVKNNVFTESLDIYKFCLRIGIPFAIIRKNAQGETYEDRTIETKNG